MGSVTETIDLKRYGRLLAKAAPRVITTEEERDRALTIVESLAEKGERKMTPEEDALLERVPFFTGFGVETGLLIDILRLGGLGAIAQVDMRERTHCTRYSVNQQTNHSPGIFMHFPSAQHMAASPRPPPA